MKRIVVALTSALVAFGVSTPVASAAHSWGSFHWARTANPFPLGLDSNLTTAGWQSIAEAASVEWSKSKVIRTPLSARQTDNKRCKPTTGRVEVCNGRYGSTGWLGIAQVWTSGGHVVQGTAKMNDTYLATSSYDATNRRQILCQEVGHTFGLGHQDESGADLDTCMDYSSKLDNSLPNEHDYLQLEAIYGHTTDSTNSATTPVAGSQTRGSLRRLDDDLYVEDLGNGGKRYVWVLWQKRGIAHGAPQTD